MIKSRYLCGSLNFSIMISHHVALDALGCPFQIWITQFFNESKAFNLRTLSKTYLFELVFKLQESPKYYLSYLKKKCFHELHSFQWFLAVNIQKMSWEIHFLFIYFFKRYSEMFVLHITHNLKVGDDKIKIDNIAYSSVHTQEKTIHV